MTDRLSDETVLALYRAWSSANYAAGFLNPTSDAVHRFRQWLASRPVPSDRHDDRMLAEYRRQEGE